MTPDPLSFLDPLEAPAKRCRDYSIEDFGGALVAFRFAARPEVILSLRPSIEAAIEARVKEEVSGFAMAILHGDDEHRGWLAEAAEMWIRERQVPPPRGKGTSNA